MECWAKEISPCEGGITGEHIISECLLDTSVNVKGLHWCRNDFKTIGSSSLVANVLCKKHNNELERVDSEAKRIKEWLPTLFRSHGVTKRSPKSSKNSKTTVGPDTASKLRPFEEFDGWLWARWLCKTHVNIKASASASLDGDFVRYSFGQSTSRAMHFYCPTWIGKRVDPKFGELKTRELFTDSGDILFYVNFYGMEWIASNVDLGPDGMLHVPEIGLNQCPARDLMDRVAAIYKSDGNRIDPRNIARMKWNWSNEPACLVVSQGGSR